MIFDRTQADVDAALSIRENKIKLFTPPTAEESAALERGFIDCSTLNRIENKQAELRDLLVSIGYSHFSIETRMWVETDIFNEVDFQRIVDNLDRLKEAFTTMPTTPQTPEVKYYYIIINDIEKILYDLDFLLNNAKRNVNFSWAMGLADTGLNFTS